MSGFTFTDWWGDSYHFTYNPDDAYWWSDGLQCAEVYAMSAEAIRKYEKAGRVKWDSEKEAKR